MKIPFNLGILPFRRPKNKTYFPFILRLQITLRLKSRNASIIAATVVYLKFSGQCCSLSALVLRFFPGCLSIEPIHPYMHTHIYIYVVMTYKLCFSLHCCQFFSFVSHPLCFCHHSCGHICST